MCLTLKHKSVSLLSDVNKTEEKKTAMATVGATRMKRLIRLDVYAMMDSRMMDLIYAGSAPIPCSNTPTVNPGRGSLSNQFTTV